MKKQVITWLNIQDNPLEDLDGIFLVAYPSPQQSEGFILSFAHADRDSQNNIIFSPIKSCGNINDFKIRQDDHEIKNAVAYVDIEDLIKNTQETHACKRCNYRP